MCLLPRDQQTRKPSSTRKTTSSKRRTTSTVRKTRTKRRKPKYLSLNLKITPDNENPKTSNKKTKMATHKQKQQLNLFPLHPESNLVPVVHENRSEMHDQDNNVVASFLFDAATDSTTTLNGLLSTATATSEESLLSPPPPYAYNGGEEGDSSNRNDDGLVRTAMRCKERDASEERWVSYSEVIVGKTAKIKEEEVNSCVDDRVCADAWCATQVQGKKRRLMLALKLDYQQILNAWSDKGPLYIDGDSPQTVPDLHDDNVALMDGWGGGVGSLWTVPEMTGSDAGDLKANEDVRGKEGCWKRDHREASVLRYKEKRQTRLFSKRIRYEVRKLNAEKRPRMKGRFVKRSSEV
ncbi:hypothetical protein Ddye_000175 [Dipteronia dyeriana]|uniref:CCT domain-containing protein n=1 Tax=Dipteronia dyeriana TaxID=168575 RepID=A0AAE0CSA8_9ROSI|nr:hypothetical protein Ddye_000175 [Dipteronia dyeriana]